MLTAWIASGVAAVRRRMGAVLRLDAILALLVACAWYWAIRLDSARFLYLVEWFWVLTGLVVAATVAVVVTEVVREGRSVAFMRARLEREDEVLAIATATFARERRSFAESFEPPRLALPPVDEVAPGPEALFLPSFSRYFQFRQAIGQEAFSGGAEAHVGGWCRLREGPVRAEAALVPVMLDSWAPAALSRHPRWAPCASIDIFVQLHRVLDGSPIDWLGYEAHSAHLDSGYADERATLYDADGRAIASAKQLIAIFD